MRWVWDMVMGVNRAYTHEHTGVVSYMVQGHILTHGRNLSCFFMFPESFWPRYLTCVLGMTDTYRMRS